ncbi:unnamed protein product [Leptidea sinapis]|uniref:beta-glucosidase n=1 Tax=Leptidea sinapis TaxID=189913 RepID=A0A5E4QMC5_9NEOP|nr:unnamed protein product [Leptidea sinapis]
MCCLTCFVLTAVATIVGVSRSETDYTAKLCFPKQFQFGVATAAYQIEGAWNISDKGENIWDRYTHQHSEIIFDHKTGDVAADSYHLYKQDVQLLVELGVSFYRFSISWSRILPDGLSNRVSEDGIRYYKELIAELNKNSIKPLVTMYHWDLPQSLQELGGWTNPIIADYFVDYARILFEVFGESVNVWITFNEPLSFCHDGYGGLDAPGDRSDGFEDYLCGHNVMRAHGKVYRMYQEEFAAKQKGFVGITLDMAWMEPASSAKEDQTTAETVRQFQYGWFTHPIFSKQGDYPPVMRKRVDAMSKRQNFARSRLPKFTAEEINEIRGSADFLGINHYTTYLVKHVETKISLKPSMDTDMGAKLYQDPSWPVSNSSWLKIVPWGFRKILNWVKQEYDNPLVIITENGVSLPPGLQDATRVSYINEYLRMLHAAVVQDRCNVIAYTHWSLMDNFEWTRGFS